MTISSQTRKAGPFVGNDSTTAFPFAFKVFTAADMYVVKTDTDLEVETVLVLNTDYTVSLNADQNANPGGTITLPSALATGFTLTVTSNISPLQQTDLTNQGGFYPSVITNALDKLTILIQQALDSVTRSLKLPVSTPSGVSTTLPLPSSNKLIGWNTAGDGLQNVDPTTLATIVAFGTANADVFDGDGVTTQFNLSANPAALNNLDVSIGGVTQTPGVDYTWTSGTVITFTSAPPVGTDNVLVRYMQALPQGASDSASSTFIQAGSGAVQRTAQEKMRESLSVKDYGAVGDPTAISNAVAASGGKPIVLNDGIHGGHAYDPGHPSEEIRIVGGAVRRDAGSWAPINDSGHDPFGITTITEQDAYTLRVNFNGDNTKVGTLLAAVDAELAPYGIIGGSSCNANYADFKFYAPVVVDLQNNTTPSVAPWLASYVTLNTSGTYSTTINHPPRALNVDPPGVTLINRVVGAGRIPAITWSSTTTTISAKGHLAALVQRTGAGTFTVSQQTTAGSVTASWSTGALTITHPDCGATGSTPMVCSHNSAYRAEVVSFTSTTVVVQFRNAAGSVVGPSDDAEMKLWFERSNALFDTPMPSGFSARVDLGYLAVPLAAIQNISLNNFWLFGAMVK